MELSDAQLLRYSRQIMLPGFGMGFPYSGELLLDSELFISLTGPAWSGAGKPAPIEVNFPNDASLLGLVLYVQGGLIDKSPRALPAVGLTEALELTIASY